MDPQVARTRLQELLSELDNSKLVLRSSGGAETGELNTVDQHPADFATNVVDEDREEASLEVVDAQRERVVAALARVEDGSYGRCIDCGRELPDERLEALPEAERCIEDQQRVDALR